MAWDFETDPEYRDMLAWADSFVSREVEPLDFVITSPYDLTDPVRQELIPPLQEEVKKQGLWACHLDRSLGGAGYGQLKLALLNEILGRSRCAPHVFGCQAPDSGNAEVLARFGTEEQKKLYLLPLLANEIGSAFSMTEPQGGADPKEFVTRAELDGDEWIINGEKWFSSEARYSTFLVLMAVTDPDGPPHSRLSMFLVPTATSGVEILRNIGYGDEPPGEGEHAYIRYTDARIPNECLLGGRRQGFAVAQSRLGSGRIHHAMRTVGMVKRAFDLMCERAVSRRTQGEALGNKQLVQEMISDSWIEMEQFRLLVLRTAWKIDRCEDYRQVIGDIAAVKAAMPTVFRNIAQRAMQVHGSIGISNEMPFVRMTIDAAVMGLADGPTEVHKLSLARHVLKHYQPTSGLFPSRHLPLLKEQALTKYADALRRNACSGGPAPE